MLSHFSCAWLFVTLWTVACQAPWSIGFSKQEYWSGLPFPSSLYVCVCVCVYCCCLIAKLCPTLLRPHGLKPARLFYPWDFPRQDYWSGVPLPSPRDLPDPGIKPVSPELQADSLPLSRKGSPVCVCVCGRTRVHTHFIYFLLNLVTPEAPALTNSHCSDP